MKVVTYNLNGIRAAARKGFGQWLQDQDADILCFQETRASHEQIETALPEVGGYFKYENIAERKGYSGTMVLTKIKPRSVSFATVSLKDDAEGRLILLDYEKFLLIDLYVPNGGSRYEFKMRYLEKLLQDVSALIKQKKQLIICTDFNIAHTEDDCSNPKYCARTTGFLPEERAVFDDFLKIGLYDSYRLVHPVGKAFTWSSSYAKTTENREGIRYRFDYILVSCGLATLVTKSETLLDCLFSDHYPVQTEFNLHI